MAHVTTFSTNWETYTWPGLLAEFGGSAITVDQGSTSQAVASAIKKDEERSKTDGIDLVTATFLVLASDLPTGFVPGPELTVTDEDSLVWTCNQAGQRGPRSLAQGAAWALPCSRRAGRGKA